MSHPEKINIVWSELYVEGLYWTNRNQN